MKIVFRAACALSLAFAPLPLHAQQGDALVLPPGMVRLRGTAELFRFDTRFAQGGGSEPLTADLTTPLTGRNFAPLRPLEERLNRFLASQSSTSVVNEESLRLGALDVDADANLQVIPIGIAVGVAPRLEIGVSVPLLRGEVLFTRLGLGGGTVGLNPARSANAELLASIGQEWRALGESGLLPTDSSALGRELQRLVRLRLPGRSLDLPDSAASITVLNQLLEDEFGLPALQSDVGPWRVGDVAVTARFQLLSSLGSSLLPTDSAGMHYRAAVSVSARLPTGVQPDSFPLLSFVPEAGHTGFGVEFDADVFLGTRLWSSVSLQYARRTGVDVMRRLVARDAPLALVAAAQPVRWSPADELSLRVVPRYRLTEAISLGAQYALLRAGSSTFEPGGGAEGAGLLDSPGGTAQTAGVGMRYSTLAAYSRGSRVLPVEVVLSYEATLSGPAFSPRSRVVLLQGSLFHRLWGSGPAGGT